MKNIAVVGFAGLLVACGTVGCSSKTVIVQGEAAATPTEPTPAPSTTATPVTPPGDHGAASTTYPAFPPAMGQLVDNGGSILTNPVIVTVTWPGDDEADTEELEGDTIGGGAYWSAITSEYGANAATSGEAYHVRLTSAPPATMNEAGADAFVAANLANGTLPTVTTGNPVYVLYLSTSTTLMLSTGQGGSEANACSVGVGGYHTATQTGPRVAYGVIPKCTGGHGGRGTLVDVTTGSASHEIAEATVDPYPSVAPAWVHFRPEDLAWEIFQSFNDENGDACEFYADAFLDANAPESGFGFSVQRQWSNKSGAAGHDPCVPAYAGSVYFNTTPLALEDISVDLTALGVGQGSITTKGYNVAVGETKTFPIGFYSDASLKAWNVKAITGGIASRSSTNVTVSLDVASGENGQKGYLTVTVNTAGKSGSELVTLVSTYGGNSHYMPLLIGSAGVTK